MFDNDVPAARLGKFSMMTALIGYGLAIFPVVGMFASLITFPTAVILAIVALVKSSSDGTRSGPAVVTLCIAIGIPLLAMLTMFLGYSLCCCFAMNINTPNPLKP